MLGGGRVMARDLMTELHVGAFARGSQDRQQNFQRRHRPGAVMQRRFAVDDRLIKLVDNFGARHRQAAAARRAAPIRL